MKYTEKIEGEHKNCGSFFKWLGLKWCLEWDFHLSILLLAIRIWEDSIRSSRLAVFWYSSVNRPYNVTCNSWLGWDFWIFHDVDKQNIGKWKCLPFEPFLNNWLCNILSACLVKYARISVLDFNLALFGLCVSINQLYMIQQTFNKITPKQGNPIHPDKKGVKSHFSQLRFLKYYGYPKFWGIQVRLRYRRVSICLTILNRRKWIVSFENGVSHQSLQPSNMGWKCELTIVLYKKWPNFPFVLSNYPITQKMLYD